MDEHTRTKYEGKFDEVKGRVKESWGSLTDDDVNKTEGKWDRMVGTIKQKTGETTETVERKLRELVDKTN